MLQINLEEAERNLKRYLKRVEAGETVVIMRSGKAVAELKPIGETGPYLRPFGLCAGQFVVPDNFDDPLPADVLASFEGE